MINTIFLCFSMIVLAIITIFLVLLFLEVLFIITEYIYENSSFIDFIVSKIQNRKR